MRTSSDDRFYWGDGVLTRREREGRAWRWGTVSGTWSRDGSAAGERITPEAARRYIDRGVVPTRRDHPRARTCERCWRPM